MGEVPEVPTGPGPQEAADEALVCSAKGCRAGAAWALVWRNPRIHGPEREKTWTACDVHRETLGQFLEVRGFLIRVDPLA